MPDEPLFFRRALRKRCPQCGEGQLFDAFAQMNETCATCGLCFRRESGAQTGAMYFRATVSEMIAAALAPGLYFFSDWSTPVALGTRTGTGTVLVLVLVLGFSHLFLPVSLAFWTAVEHAADVSNGERRVNPRT